MQSRVWFVTGASRGLGKAIVEAALEAGERVVATCRHPSTLADLSSKYPASQLLVQPLDVKDTNQIKAAFDATRNQFQRLDVVVNNAGYAVLGEIEGIEDAQARDQFEVMFWGPVNITKEAIRFFRDVNPAGTGGLVFNISTAGGYSANAALAFYSAAKFALEGFTEAFIKEMVPEWNIRGCIIEPGGIQTDWSGSSMTILPPHPAYADPNTPSSQMRELLSKLSPAGDPKKMAQAILDLSNEKNELPLRLQLGSESLAIVRNKAEKTIREGEKFAWMSHSTNKDGVKADLGEIAITLT